MVPAFGRTEAAGDGPQDTPPQRRAPHTPRDGPAVLSAGRVRLLAVLAVVAAAVLVAVVLVAGGKPYTVTAKLVSASRLVKGNRVQVAGEEVGQVEAIKLT